MTTMTKTRLWDIPQLFALYRTSCPRSERKPFGIILRMAREGRADLWTIRHRGRFAGLAATVNGPDIVLLDYFAVKRSLRGRGVGSAALMQLEKQYADRGYLWRSKAPWRKRTTGTSGKNARNFMSTAGWCP